MECVKQKASWDCASESNVQETEHVEIIMLKNLQDNGSGKQIIWPTSICTVVSNSLTPISVGIKQHLQRTVHKYWYEV